MVFLVSLHADLWFELIVRKRTEELTLVLKTVYRQNLDAEVKEVITDPLLAA